MEPSGWILNFRSAGSSTMILLHMPNLKDAPRTFDVRVQGLVFGRLPFTSQY